MRRETVQQQDSDVQGRPEVLFVQYWKLGNKRLVRVCHCC
jgi:hypothetical protein